MIENNNLQNNAGTESATINNINTPASKENNDKLMVGSNTLGATGMSGSGSPSKEMQKIAMATMFLQTGKSSLMARMSQSP
jgi:hypothetical protein